MMNRPFRIGTRGSALALWQANFIKGLLLENYPDLITEINIIKTEGDRDQKSDLSEIGGKGVFVKEIEDALLTNKIDAAVHSMKDMPAVLPDGLAIGGVPERHDPRDALLTRGGFTLDRLPEGARVGTGSLRRGAQLLSLRPDLEILPLRGNVDTRIWKLREGDEYDAIILAAAGLGRMGLTAEASDIIPPDVMVPAPGQGIIAVEGREDDPWAFEITASITHEDTWTAAVAERAFLRGLGGDCNVPAGAYAEVERRFIRMTGIIASPDGRRIVRETVTGPVREPEELGEGLARILMENGGSEILSELSG